MKNIIENKESIGSYFFDLLIKTPAKIGLIFIPALTIIYQINAFNNGTASLVPTIGVTWACISVYILFAVIIIKKLKERRNTNEKHNI